MEKAISRRISMLLAVFMCLGLLGMPPVGAMDMGENLIKNHDFSKDMSGWKTNAVSASVDKAEMYQGMPSMKYTKSAKHGRVDADSIEMRPGSRYLLAVNVKMGKGQSATANISLLHGATAQYEHLSLTSVSDSWTTIRQIYTCVSTVQEMVTPYIRTDEDKTFSDKAFYFNNFRCIPLDKQEIAEEVKDKNTAEFRSSLYVDAKNGNDSYAGTIDSPYKTIGRVKEEIRKFNKNMQKDINVYLRGGNYEITEPIRFESSDSATNGYKIVYQGYEDEKPFVRGPKVITGWSMHDGAKNIYKAKADGKIETRSLYVNGERAVRAKSNAGLTNASQYEEGLVTSDTFLAKWKNTGDMEMVFAQHWTLPRQGVQSIEVKNDMAYIKMKQPGWASAKNKGQTSVTTPWYYENAYELLDEPGEWYLDRSTYTFYYMPRDGEDMATADVVAPVLEELMSVKGDSESRPITNIEFRGISFGYSTWLRPNSEWGVSDAQNNHIRDSSPKPAGVSGDWLPPAAIMVQYGHGIVFDSCTFSKLGLNALQMIDGIQDSVVNGNVFYDISAGCVNLGEPYTNDSNNYNPSQDIFLIKNNKITNNYMHDVCKEYMSAAAISVGFPQSTQIANNEIFHIPYSGMHIGYGWKSIPTSAIRDLDITHNYIHDIFYTKLYDGGGIYTIGPTSGTKANPNMLAYNYITDMNNDGGPIYNDQGSTFYKVYKNVIDQSRATDWVSGKPKWFKGWGKDLSDCYLVDNFTNISHIVRDGGDNDEISGTVFCPDGWPQEAQDIINQAGLEAKYGHLSNVPQKILLDKKMYDLKSGETVQIDFNVETSKNKPFDLSEATVGFSSRNKKVATVDKNGEITAASQGETYIDMMVRKDDITVRESILIHVDDVADKIKVIAEKNGVLLGDELQIKVMGETFFGSDKEVSDVTYTSDNSEIVAVVGDGLLRGVKEGNAVISVSAVCQGKTFQTVFPMRVVDYVSSVPTQFIPSNIDNIIADVNGWNIQGTGTKKGSAGTITFNTPGGSANYQNKMFTNEIFDFDLQIDNNGGWPSIQFRGLSSVNTMNDGVNSGYIIVMKESEIELQRFNKGVRRVFFGDISGSVALGGKAYPNNDKLIPYGKKVRIQCGAINESDGVRLILTADGKRIFDYLDTDYNRVTSPGYFGVVSRNGDMTLSAVGGAANQPAPAEQIGEPTGEPTDEPTDEAQNTEKKYSVLMEKYKAEAKQKVEEVKKDDAKQEEAGDFVDTKGHWAEILIHNMVRSNMISGVSKTTFEPDRPIKRSEFLTLIIRWLKYEKDMEWTRHASSWGTETFKAKIRAQQALYTNAAQSAGTDKWYAKIIEVAANDDLIDDALLMDDYSLDDYISREEMASMLLKAYQVLTLETIYSKDISFADKADISEWAYDAVRSISKMGYMKGDENGYFNPRSTATRAEAAAVIQRVYDAVEIR